MLAAAVVAAVLIVTLSSTSERSGSFPPPSSTALAGLGVRERIATIANRQVGYGTHPKHTYCNKFSAYWHAGTASCPGGELSEQWCADFAAWVWQKARVRFSYGYAPGEINAGAASFYRWGLANNRWHPEGSGYVAAPGDVAVYGLSLGTVATAAHVAVVTADSSGQRGPDVINGDGDRTGFSVVESVTDEIRADDGQHRAAATLAGYVSPA